MRPSMGSVGDAYDNAMCESLFSSLESELLARRRFRSQAEAKMAAFGYVEGFYNPRRLHSALGCRSPIASEEDHARAAQTTPTDQDPEPSARSGQTQTQSAHSNGFTGGRGQSAWPMAISNPWPPIRTFARPSPPGPTLPAPRQLEARRPVEIVGWVRSRRVGGHRMTEQEPKPTLGIVRLAQGQPAAAAQHPPLRRPRDGRSGAARTR